MQKTTVSFGVSSGDTKGKEILMGVSTRKLDPTSNNGEEGMLSTMVLATGITLDGAVNPCGSMVLTIGITLNVIHLQ